jgi:type IV pilus assembly protein PilQ
MNKINRLLQLVTLPVALIVSDANALQLNKVSSTVSSGISEVSFDFDTASQLPQGFILQNPPRLVLDFLHANLNKSIEKKIKGSGNVERVDVVQAKDRIRATIRLGKTDQYVTERRGNRLVVVLLNDAATGSSSASDQDWVNHVIKGDSKSVARVTATTKTLLPNANVPSAPHVVKNPDPVPIVQSQVVTRPVAVMPEVIAEPLPPVSHRVYKRLLGNIDFRRDEKGNGRVIVNLPDDHVKTEVRKSGNSVVVTLKGVDITQSKKTYNVLDFATSVNSITVSRQGADARLKALVRGAFTYSTERKGKQLHILINKKEKRVSAEDLQKKKKRYKGDKLTLNFQDIEVRSVLQLLADFTDKNIVVSDTVTGSITLRLKDVPWDQAMDIVLRSKGLGMRENGNVIWVAPEAELASRENRELEQLKKRRTLDPLITEYMSVNFAKAADLAALVNSSKDGSGSLLSKRGSISVDNRTNTILVHDTVANVEDVRAMIKQLDVPVRQVAIESRIVIASDDFSKALGARFGATGIGGFDGNSGIATTSGSLSGTDSVIGDAAGNLNSSGNVFPVGIPGLNDRLNVNLPVAGALGSFGFSILSKDLLLDLELSALQAESKGEIVSTPRVVTTNQTTAIIEQGVEVPFQQASSSGAANVAFKKAVLSLEVTPQITPEEHVIMELKVNQDTIGRVFSGVPSIDTRNVKTKVLVDNGQTVVLGGVHVETNQNDVERVPLLSDLPVVGRIFRRTTRSNDKRELLIFVTPRILD